MIFTKETGFTEASGLGYDAGGLNRLNARFEVFMTPFKAEFEGARVLDLASHDGRWSYAALTLGAEHVTGIEGRPELIEKGRHIFEQEQFRGRADFIAGDIFDVMSEMRARGETFDIVLCLGIFYHVMDHFRLLKLMRSLNPSLIILDTGLIDVERPIIALKTEPNDHFLNTIASGYGRDTLIGIVSKGGLELMARSLSFDLCFLDWEPSRFQNKSNLHDYFKGGRGKNRRFSAVLRRSARSA